MEFLTLNFFLLVIGTLTVIVGYVLIMAKLRISFLESQLKDLTGVVSGIVSLVKDHESDIRGIKNSFAEMRNKGKPKERVTNQSTTTETRK